MQKGQRAGHRTGGKLRRPDVKVPFIRVPGSRGAPAPSRPAPRASTRRRPRGGQDPRTRLQKLLPEERGPSTKHWDRIPKGRQPRPAPGAAPRLGGTRQAGKVGSARAAPPGSGLPSPGPRFLPLRLPNPPSHHHPSNPRSPRAPARAPLRPRPAGQRPPPSPHRRARGHPAGGRTAPASRGSTLRSIPTPHPAHRTPPSTALESRVPPAPPPRPDRVSPSPGAAALPGPRQAHPEY